MTTVAKCIEYQIVGFLTNNVSTVISGQKREPSAGRSTGPTSFLDRTTSSHQVYPTDPSTNKFPYNYSHDSSKDMNAFRRHRVDSESSTNVVKNAVLRRTDEMDDSIALPRMSASTVSLTAQPSNREQTLNRIANQTNRHSGNERIYEGARYGSQAWKDDSPTKSIPR